MRVDARADGDKIGIGGRRPYQDEEGNNHKGKLESQKKERNNGQKKEGNIGNHNVSTTIVQSNSPIFDGFPPS